MTDDRVVFDTDGHPVASFDPGLRGPATLVVAPVTDAVKRLSGDVVESLDRDSMWVVEAIVLEREVLDLLGPGEMTADQLWQAVTNAGYSWRVIPTSSL